MQTVLLSDVAAQPWRNGGGVTQELLLWPGADWALRISVAGIDRSGPFSAYPGVERWFAVLQGEGVVLKFPRRRVMMSAGSEPLRFEGASAPDCELLDGATQDLNLMVQGSAGRGAMLLARSGEAWVSTARLRAVFTAEAATLCVDGAEAAVMAAGTLAWTDNASGQLWSLQGTAAAARALWLQFKPKAP